MPREMDIAKVTTEITARSGTIAGTGSAESVYRENTDPNATSSLHQYDNIHNWFSSSIAVDEYIAIYRVHTGEWVVHAADCQ